jgi:polysaccharide biosynthesis protein PslG
LFVQGKDPTLEHWLEAFELKRSALFLAAAAALLVATLARPSESSAQYRAASPEYGVSAFLLGKPDTTARDLGIVSGAGIGWIKLTVPWRSIEPSCKGCYAWEDLDRVVSAATASGVKIMARVDHSPDWARAVPAENGPPDNISDYTDIVTRLVARYGTGSPIGRIDAVEIWNEPNLDREWGGKPISRQTAREYLDLLKDAYQGAKEADPNVTVVTAGLSPTGTNTGAAMPDDVYLDWLFRDGLAGHYDVLGAHGAGYGNAPEVAPIPNGPYTHPSFFFRRVEQLRAIQEAYGDAGKQIWLLEFGWTTDQVNPDYSWYAVSPETQADYLVRAYQFAKSSWAPWIGVMFAWTMADSAWTPANEQYWWSITEPDGTPRLALQAFQTARQNGTLP